VAGRVLLFVAVDEDGDPEIEGVEGEVGPFEYDIGVVLREDGWIDGE
jgi:hypothetical protein